MDRRIVPWIFAGLAVMAAGPALGDEPSPWFKDRETQFAAWKSAHADMEAQIADLKAKTAALIQSGGQGSTPAVWNVPGTIAEVWDAPETPRMTVIPAGRFVMGSPATEPGRTKFEDPQHVVTIAQPFAVGTFDVTYDEWEACVFEGGCNNYHPADEGWGRGDRPVVNVNYNDAQAYVAWLQRRTGMPYRLVSEAEWEYAARAGSQTTYSWGDSASHDQANYGTDNCCAGAMASRDQWFYSSPVGSFPANPFGLFDMNGNVFQLMQDCWLPNYQDTPRDGSAFNHADCGLRVIRGGSWSSTPYFMRTAARIWAPGGERVNIVGFRVARTL